MGDRNTLSGPRQVAAASRAAAVRDKHERTWTGPSASALHAKQPCRGGLSRRRVTLSVSPGSDGLERDGRSVAMRDKH